MNRHSLYSIGHSSRSIDELLSLLTGHAVRLLVDVRRYPGSRRHPQFHRHALEHSLGLVGIEYLHLGKELGGFTGTEYRDYIESEPFSEGLARLERLAAEKTTAFLCAERLPWHCHRRYIAEELGKKGWRVVHILDRSTVWDADQPFFLEAGAE